MIEKKSTFQRLIRRKKEINILHAKANVFKINPFWIQTHTSSQLKPFTALIFPPTTNQVSKKDSRSVKPWHFYALTLQEQLWNRTFINSNHVSVLRGYPKCLIETLLSDIRFTKRELGLRQRKWKAAKRYFFLCDTVSPGSAKPN